MWTMLLWATVFMARPCGHTRQQSWCKLWYAIFVISGHMLSVVIWFARLMRFILYLVKASQELRPWHALHTVALCLNMHGFVEI